MAKIIEREPFEVFLKSTLAQYFRKKKYNDYVFDPYGHIVDEIYYFAELLGVKKDVEMIIEPERRKREIKTLFELLDVKHKIYAIADVKHHSSGLLGRYNFKKENEGGDAEDELL